MEDKLGTQSKKKSVSFGLKTADSCVSSDKNKDDTHEDTSQEGDSSPKIDKGRDPPKSLSLKNRTVSKEEVVNSFRESMESTPHSDVSQKCTEPSEHKGPRWKVVIPVVCLVIVSLIVVIGISVTTSTPPIITKIDGMSPSTGM